MTRTQLSLAAAGTIIGLVLLGLVLPNWLQFLATMAASHGIVSLGILLIMRGGLVSFGQGMVFALGGYAVALCVIKLGITDALLLLVIGGAVAGLIGAVTGPLLARYSGIFFGMLTLALSMVLYGILIKSTALGGSDGFNIPRPSLFGRRLEGPSGDYALYVLAILTTGLASWATAMHIRSARGLVTQAIQANPLRVEYLGTSVQSVMATNFALAAVLGGLGGALTVLALGHIEPTFAFWTQSGEFVFVAILAGSKSVIAIFVASLALELVRSFSSLYFPNTWQMALGLFLLAIILFLPNGIGSLWTTRAASRRAAEEPTEPAREATRQPASAREGTS
ncbi:branched-chain amino acid ABC transporter permease [Phreatobacter stygius]|uniref:Branched-chain amino acid ABC transporter permease n=1 Tax=Phreatobacter stygius TaxID=1940610 RepID=A0A4D7B2W3_9HYPH|nr:branched-chain amino acid ABC transporter permease [Phreatobacter stygius]QCI67874.1 branched-chain amino acid ABC transporter permease [Phreatobacter stygius]